MKDEGNEDFGGNLSEATLQPGQDLLDGHSGHLLPVFVNDSQQGEG